VVMGDLSACRTDRAPGGFRPEAAAFDASIAEAFRGATPHRLLDLDPTRAATLLASGWIPLQVLAGAFEQTDPHNGRVLYEGAPYGVGYLVANLTTR
jgi:aromatic ring-opening dioxygenase LigB subunit